MEREYLVTAAEMQQYDRNSIDKIGIPQMVLMERAAYAVAKEAINYSQENHKYPCRVLVAAGSGNNGADAIAAGRILKEYGFDIEVFLIDDLKSECAVKQSKIASYYDIPFSTELSDRDYDIIIDGLFGIGLNRELNGEQKKVIGLLNKKNGYKISVDIPTGINASNGEMYGDAFMADVTVTFGFYKLGLFLSEGKKHAGKIKKKEIGISKYSFNGTIPQVFTYDSNTESAPVDFHRNPDGNKGTFGKVCIIAGRNHMTGAAVLAATSALRSGCGMVCVVSEKESSMIVRNSIPEIIVHSYNNAKEAVIETRRAIDWADVVAVGPGIGTDDIACEMVMELLNTSKKTIVFDADAITVLAENNEFFEILRKRQMNMETRGNIIFTPHLKEFSRLLHKDISEVKENRYMLCQEFVSSVHGIVVLKDSRTLVCKKDEPFYFNLTGNDGMATAGSGDVLTGLIASIAAQTEKKKEDIFEAVCMAVFIHGKAGERASELTCNSYCTAGDLIKQFCFLMK